MDKPSVIIGIPCFDGKISALTVQTIFRTLPGPVEGIIFVSHNPIDRASTYLWHNALRTGKATHFCMIHADVGIHPEDPNSMQWLEILLERMEKHNLDIISTVIPRKDWEGATSTGFDMADLSDPLDGRALPLAALKLLPQFFNLSDCQQILHIAKDAKGLLFNTGLWLADLRKPWAKDVFFNAQVGLDTTKATPEVTALSEDWDFSRWCRGGGLRVEVTQLFRILHEGTQLFDSQEVPNAHK